MKQEIANKWADMLESGEYPQSKMSLRSPEGYCCLGVLCELYRQETESGEWEDDGFVTNNKKMWSSDWSAETLPLDVQEWAGMVSADGTYDYTKSLVRLNDSANFKFTGIATFIRKNWEKL